MYKYNLIYNIILALILSIFLYNYFKTDTKTLSSFNEIESIINNGELLDYNCLRKSIIDEYKNNPHYEKIKYSIENIKIYKSNPFADSSLGYYILLSKEGKQYFNLDLNELILINKNIEHKDIESTIVHELYHVVYNIIKSDIIIPNPLTYNNTQIQYSNIKPYLTNYENNICLLFFNKYDYYTKKTEIYSYIKTLHRYPNQEVELIYHLLYGDNYFNVKEEIKNM